MAGTALWTGLLVPVGAISALLGAARALGETQLKRVLAYSTISALGVLVALLGAGTSKAVVAAMVYLVAHALYKGALFLGAGAIHHASGVDDLRELGGLRRATPRVALAMLLAAASFAGAPPLLGFLGKDLAYEGLWPPAPGGLASLSSLLAAFVASALFVAVAVELGVRPFLGRPAERLAGARDPSPWLWAPPMILAALGLALGVAPRALAPLASAAAADVLRAPVPESAALLHGITPAVILSVATLAAGLLVWAARAPLIRAGRAVAAALRLRPAAGYELGLRALAAVALRQTRVLQSGYLSWYVLALIGTITALVGAGLAYAPLDRWERVSTDLRLEDLGLVALVLAAAGVAVATRSRFAAIAAMGVVGLAVGAIYLTLGAPDLAMTQFVVEVLNVAVFVIAFSRVPGFVRLSSGSRRLRDACVAIAFGAVMVVLVLAASGTEPDHRVSDWHAANAVAAGHGHNVVNVILTDFRSLDTLGEVTVVACAAFGVLALLRVRSAAA
ncbi:MAG: proton-conducting transporter membrane subunit [Sandaracinaceae bacterium]|nr:proton-conducting transporter membrane subunit [Sandaracinaceae bacterium]